MNLLVKACRNDLEDTFVNKCIIFKNFCELGMSVSEMLLKQIHIIKMVSSFPNLNISFRIYLSIFGTSCEGKSTFSVLRNYCSYRCCSMED